MGDFRLVESSLWILVVFEVAFRLQLGERWLDIAIVRALAIYTFYFGEILHPFGNIKIT